MYFWIFLISITSGPHWQDPGGIISLLKWTNHLWHQRLSAAPAPSVILRTGWTAGNCWELLGMGAVQRGVPWNHVENHVETMWKPMASLMAGPGQHILKLVAIFGPKIIRTKAPKTALDTTPLRFLRSPLCTMTRFAILAEIGASSLCSNCFKLAFWYMNIYETLHCYILLHISYQVQTSSVMWLNWIPSAHSCHLAPMSHYHVSRMMSEWCQYFFGILIHIGPFCKVLPRFAQAWSIGPVSFFTGRGGGGIFSSFSSLP